MSAVRIYRWGDPAMPAGAMAAIAQPRSWVMVCAPGWGFHPVSWTDRVEATLPDGTRVLAGNDAPVGAPAAKEDPDAGS